MHKKLTSELTSLAHDILTFKKRDDVFALKQKAYEVYEKLAVLAYIEEYINNTPQAKETKDELIEQFEKSLERKEEVSKKAAVVEAEEKEEQEQKAEEIEVKPKEETKKEEELVEEKPTIVKNTKDATEEAEGEFFEDEKFSTEPTVDITFDKGFREEMTEETLKTDPIEQPFDELQQLLFDEPKIKTETGFTEDSKTMHTLEDELKDTLSVDITANLFEKAPPKRSLNDMLQSTIQIGLNDRIAFVKHLFNGNQSDYNRVISQLNTIKTEKEAKSFIKKMIKPEYNWNDKEEYETRLMEIIERKFA